MPMEKYLEYYNPYLVDPIKWAPEFNTDYLNANKGEFFKTWFSLLKSNFGIYVEQYLMGTYGFWHIGGDTPYEFVKTEIAGNDWGIYQVNFLIINWDILSRKNWAINMISFLPDCLSGCCCMISCCAG